MQTTDAAIYIYAMCRKNNNNDDKYVKISKTISVIFMLI